MNTGWIKTILDWSEVWALLIPITVFLFKRKQPGYMRPVVFYLFLGLILNTLCDIGYVFKSFAGSLLQPNNYLYNIHSIVRFACFSSFFIGLQQPMLPLLKKILPFVVYGFIAINFFFFEDFFRASPLSSRLFAAETGALLIYCAFYFFFLFQY